MAATVPERVAAAEVICPALAALALGPGATAASARPAPSTATQRPTGRHETPVRAIPEGASDCSQPGAGERTWSETRASPWAPTAAHSPPAAHDAAVKAPVRDAGVALQVAVASAGFALASTCPASSTARQLVVDAHVIAVVGGEGSIALTRQPPPAGWVLTATSPALLTAAQRLSTHETPDSDPWTSSGVGCHWEAPPVGVVLTRTSPPAVAAQREAEAQDTPVMAPFATAAGPTQDDAPASGLELAKTRPDRSPATHSPEGLQETELRACSPSIRCRLHFAEGEPAFELTKASPAPSTATHSPSEAQETAVGAPPSSNTRGPDQPSGAAARVAGARIASRPSATARDTIHRAVTRVYCGT